MHPIHDLHRSLDVRIALRDAQDGEPLVAITRPFCLNAESKHNAACHEERHDSARG